MKGAGRFLAGIILVVLMLAAANYMGIIHIQMPQQPSIPGAPSTPTPTGGGGVSAYLPIEFMVKCRNGTALEGATVEIYKPGEGDVWALVGSYVSGTSSGSQGKVATSPTRFNTGDKILIHIVHGTYDGKKVTDTWTERTVGAKQADETVLPVEDVVCQVAPSSSSKMDIKLFDKDWNAIGESDAAATSLSLSSGAADWVTYPGTLKLIVNEKWTGFGGQVVQYKTSQGHEARTWVSVVTWEFNRTDVSFASSGWTQVSGTSSSVKKYAKIVDRVEATTSIPVSLEMQIKFKATSLSAGTPFKVTVTWYDFQIWDDVVGNIFNTSEVSPDPAATYSVSQSFYLKVVA
jgi:hypothetical protein